MNGLQEVLIHEARHQFPVVHRHYHSPPLIVDCEGCYLIDQRGQRYLDCYSGDGVMNAGYRNPMILNAVVDQLWRLQHVGADCLVEQATDLARELAEFTPEGSFRSYFCSTIAEARAAAARIATHATGRDLFISPPPTMLSGFADLEHRIAEAGRDPLAGILVEPIFYEAGALLPPDGYWAEIRERCTRDQILLIFDESRTGMNRTGRWFASDHWGVVPDIRILGAAVTNGIPFAAVLASESIALCCDDLQGLASTANPVACAAGMATIRFHRTAALAGRAARHGAQLLAEIADVVGRSDHLANPRGKGLYLAVDVIDEHGQPDAVRCDAYREQMKDWGFLFGKAGPHGNVITIMPPLTISEEQLPLIASAFAEVQRPPPAAPALEG